MRSATVAIMKLALATSKPGGDIKASDTQCHFHQGTLAKYLMGKVENCFVIAGVVCEGRRWRTWGLHRFSRRYCRIILSELIKQENKHFGSDKSSRDNVKGIS